MSMHPSTQSSERGYIALLAVLIVGAATTAIALTLLMTGVDSQRSTAISQQSVQARNLAFTCGQEALQQIHDNGSFTGSNPLSMGQGSCTYTVTNPGANIRNIISVGTVGGVSRKINATATIGAAAITLSSWQEGPSLSGTPLMVQSLCAAPGGTPTSVAAVYAAQTAGDTNVIAVGWSNNTTTISSVTDTAGNTYQVAAALTRGGTTTSQVMYYAKNIVASATNTVTVTFSAASSTPDLRIMEYSGLDTTSPLDSAGSGSGSSTAAATASFTTTTANDLIVAAGTTQADFTLPGANFSLRMISSPNNNIAEDRIAATAGSYTGTATLTTGQWVMQAAAFKASSQ